MIYLWLYYQVAPRARGATLWATSGALRVLERIRRSTGQLLEQGGTFRAGEQAIRDQAARQDYLRALERLSKAAK